MAQAPNNVQEKDKEIAQAPITLNATYKAILLSALDMKVASIKRAKNTEKSPRFQQVYDLEMRETLETQAYISAIKETE